MEDEKDKNKKSRQEPAPITDGDARPDKFVDPDFSQTKESTNKPSSPVSSSRQADVDKTEDYKDAK